MVNGYRTAQWLLEKLKACTLAQVQHCFVKNSCHHINILSKVLQYFPCIFRSILKRDKLELDLWTQRMNLWPKFHKNCAGVIGDVPIRMMSVFSCMAFFARTTESLQYWIMYFVSLYRELPAFVRESPLWVLSKSCTPKSASSRLICFKTAVGVIYACSAALLKLPASATRINVSSCGLYIASLPFLRFSYHISSALFHNNMTFSEKAIYLLFLMNF